MLRIALTGGIASGKSRVADAFAARGVPVVDSDRLAREIVAPGSPALAAIHERFGGDAIAADGTLDRRRLRERIFSDAEERRALEAILHPRIRALMDARLGEHAAQGAPWALAVIPLLVETGQAERFDRVIVVDAPDESRIARLCARDGHDEAQARAILAGQASRAERLRAADKVIVNDDAAAPDATLAPRIAELDGQFRQTAATSCGQRRP